MLTVEQTIESLREYDVAGPQMNERIANAFIESGILDERPILVCSGMAAAIQWMLAQEMIQ